MGSSWVIVCPIAFLMVLLSSASKVMQTESSILQRPINLAELLKGASGIEMTPRGSQPTLHQYPPVEQYPVQFPLGQPTSDNLQAICLHGDRRPRYPKSYFPSSGFGSQVRKGNAVNKAESWFGTCCKGNQTWESEVTLCCVTLAWEKSIKSFCKEEFSIKTSHYHCCQLRGEKRLTCFHKNAPNPNYEPTEEIPIPVVPSNNFKFFPSTCQRHAGE